MYALEFGKNGSIIMINLPWAEFAVSLFQSFSVFFFFFKYNSRIY